MLSIIKTLVIAFAFQTASFSFAVLELNSDSAVQSMGTATIKTGLADDTGTPVRQLRLSPSPSNSSTSRTQTQSTKTQKINRGQLPGIAGLNSEESDLNIRAKQLLSSSKVIEPIGRSALPPSTGDSSKNSRALPSYLLNQLGSSNFPDNYPTQAIEVGNNNSRGLSQQKSVSFDTQERFMEESSLPQLSSWQASSLEVPQIPALTLANAGQGNCPKGSLPGKNGKCEALASDSNAAALTQGSSGEALDKNFFSGLLNSKVASPPPLPQAAQEHPSTSPTTGNIQNGRTDLTALNTAEDDTRPESEIKAPHGDKSPPPQSKAPPKAPPKKEQDPSPPKDSEQKSDDKGKKDTTPSENNGTGTGEFEKNTAPTDECSTALNATQKSFTDTLKSYVDRLNIYIDKKAEMIADFQEKHESNGEITKASALDNAQKDFKALTRHHAIFKTATHKKNRTSLEEVLKHCKPKELLKKGCSISHQYSHLESPDLNLRLKAWETFQKNSKNFAPNSSIEENCKDLQAVLLLARLSNISLADEKGFDLSTQHGATEK